MSLQDLILIAYDLKEYQLTGPAWLNSERFDIVANVPAGATKEQIRPMLQNLLAERFGLAVHRERKEMATDELVVARTGPRLAESVPRKPGEQPPVLDRSRMTRDKYGLPIVPPGISAIASTSNGRYRRHAAGETMEALASSLANLVGRPVFDRTGLKGKYDFVLTWTTELPAAAPPDEEMLPTLAAALQEQLGLKLESGKAEVEVLVVDRVEKTPTAN